MSVARARSLRKQMTPAEAKMWNALRALRPEFRFRRQVPIQQFVVDFACHSAHLVIEIDGDTHGTEAARDADKWRTEIIETEGYRVVRFTNEDVRRNIEGVMTSILTSLEAT